MKCFHVPALIGKLPSTDEFKPINPMESQLHTITPVISKVVLARTNMYVMHRMCTHVDRLVLLMTNCHSHCKLVS